MGIMAKVPYLKPDKDKLKKSEDNEGEKTSYSLIEKIPEEIRNRRKPKADNISKSNGGRQRRVVDNASVKNVERKNKSGVLFPMYTIDLTGGIK